MTHSTDLLFASTGLHPFVDPVSLMHAERRRADGRFPSRGGFARQRCLGGFTREPGRRGGSCSGELQQVLLLPLQHHLLQPAGKLSMHANLPAMHCCRGRIFLKLYFVLKCVLYVELQESHEQHFPPAEDDGNPTHEQRLPG